MDQDRQEIAQVIEHYRHGIATLDASELQGIWDRAHDPLIYVALERADAIRDWRGIATYYDRLAESLAHVDAIDLSGVTIDWLGDTAIVFLRFHFEGALHGQTRIADGRITFVLHRTGEGWRVIHYHESALGPQGG